MYSNWCEGTTVQFEAKKLKSKRTVVESSVNAHMQREKMLNEVYRKGGCTFGDMNYGRHQNLVYRNDYPCGSTCSTCKTFFID